MRCYESTGDKVGLPAFGGQQSRSKNLFDVLLLRIKLHFRKHHCPTLNGYLLITKAEPPPTIHCPRSLWFLTAPSFFKSRGGHVPVTSYRRPHFSLQAAWFRNETFTHNRPVCVILRNTFFLFIFFFSEPWIQPYPVHGSQVAEPPRLSLHQTPEAKTSTEKHSQQGEASAGADTIVGASTSSL